MARFPDGDVAAGGAPRRGPPNAGINERNEFKWEKKKKKRKLTRGPMIKLRYGEPEPIIRALEYNLVKCAFN